MVEESDKVKVIPHYLRPNFNRYWPSERELGQPRSVGHGNSLSGIKDKWGVLNAQVGRRGTNYLDLSTGIDALSQVLKCISQENNFVLFFTRIFDSLSGLFAGLRDKEMYYVYGSGIDSVPHEALDDQKETLSSLSEGEIIDDALVDGRDAKNLGEREVFNLWGLATKFAYAKPIVQLIAGFTSGNVRDLVMDFMDTPARVLWRARFFGRSLHTNFVSTMWDLIRLGIMSVFNRNKKTEFDNLCKILRENSNQYFINKYGKEHGVVSNSLLGLYPQMLLDRMREHWNIMRDPKEAENALDQKYKDGYIKKDDNFDVRDQRRHAAIDFLGPICGSLGIIGTLVFVPVQTIWRFANIGKYSNLVNFSATLRKLTQGIYYWFAFVKPEEDEGSKYKTLEEKIIHSNEEIKAATEELYNTRLARYKNAQLAKIMVLVNILEPIVQLFRPKDNQLFKLFTGILGVVNSNLLSRFFSKRRELQGRLAVIKSLIPESQDSAQELQALQALDYDRATLKNIYDEKENALRRDVGPNLLDCIGLVFNEAVNRGKSNLRPESAFLGNTKLATPT